MEIDRERILQLVAVLKSSPAAELTVQEGGMRVRLRRALPADAPGASPTATDDVEVTVDTPGMETAGQAGAVTVLSRQVGLFYRSREPGGEPLVQVGQQVAEGQVLGLVDVLRKHMEVTSPAAGTVLQIIPEEGAGVQYGDPLFVIQP